MLKNPIYAVVILLFQMIFVFLKLPHEIAGFISFSCWDFQRISIQILVIATFGALIFSLCKRFDKNGKRNSFIYGSLIFLLILHISVLLLPIIFVNTTGGSLNFKGVVIGQSQSNEMLCRDKYTIKIIPNNEKTQLCWENREDLYSQRIYEFHGIKNRYGINIKSIKPTSDTLEEIHNIKTGFFDDYMTKINRDDSINNARKRKND